jgi:hypothetical protein
MAVDERSRHELYRRLDEVLGSEAATTLIEHLPPVGWADVATKNDLRNLEERLELRFDRIDDRFGRVEDRFAAIDGRFDRVDDRFAAIDDRFDRVDDRFAAMEERFDRVDDRFAAVEERMGLRFDAMGSDLRASFEHELRTQTTTMIFALVGVVLTMAGLAFALARFT